MPIFLILVFFFGLIIGSFLNCLIWRTRKEESLMGRSYCPKCEKQIAWYDNIPLVSFIMLKGRCRHCGQKISWQYPAVELITGFLFVLAFVQNFELRVFNFESIIIQNSKLIIQLLRDWFIIAVMIVIFVQDLRWQVILDLISLPACLIALALNLWLGFSLFNLAISGIIGGSFFLIQYLISRGRWIGGGDIRLGLLIGLSLGWPGVVMAILLGYFIGSAAGLGLIAGGRKTWQSKMPLGAFLAAGALITLFWQGPILGWYRGLF